VGLYASGDHAQGAAGESNRPLFCAEGRLLEGKPVTFIRIYDPHASEEAWQVKDFTYLDRHPGLILYEGYWEKGGDHLFLECKASPKPQSQ
jgi:hypothetical protein